MPSPKPSVPVSVVMPVHNARPYVDDAIRSILGQSFADFEFVIFDDGSTDGSLERLRYWASRDDRIRLLESERNLGPVASSNRVAKEARAPLVARMDADDISHPQRLEAQVKVLGERPDFGLVGTLCESIDSEGRRLRGPDVWRLTRHLPLAPFPHGSIMYRRDLFALLGGYRDECEFWEDQDLVLRAARVAMVGTIPRALYQYRHSPASTRLTSNPERVERAADLACRAMAALHRDGSYEDLLKTTAPSGRIDPRVFVSLGSIELWGGDRPNLVGRFLKRARLRPDVATLGALVWTAWAAVEPRSLRQVMRGVAALRNQAAGAVEQASVVEWHAHRALPGDVGESDVSPGRSAWPDAAE